MLQPFQNRIGAAFVRRDAGFAQLAFQVGTGRRFGQFVLGLQFSGTLLLLLPDTPASEGLVSVERLRRQIVGLTLSPSQPQLRPTVSIGVAAHRAHDTLAHTLERAERALQVAQDGGRNRCMAASA